RTGTQLSGQPGASYVKSLKKTADSYTLMQLRDAFADCGKLRFGLSATRSCGGAGPNCLWRRAATGAADQVFPDASSSRAAYMPVRTEPLRSVRSWCTSCRTARPLGRASTSRGNYRLRTEAVKGPTSCRPLPWSAGAKHSSRCRTRTRRDRTGPRTAGAAGELAGHAG